jgi:hypothetical protein
MHPTDELATIKSTRSTRRTCREFRYRLRLLILHGGASVNFFLTYRRHEECLLFPNPFDITILELLMIALDVSSELPILPVIIEGSKSAYLGRYLTQ